MPTRTSLDPSAFVIPNPADRANILIFCALGPMQGHIGGMAVFCPSNFAIPQFANASRLLLVKRKNEQPEGASYMFFQGPDP
jgi:hypothetical protein